jgi:hypothetical protein
MKINSVTLALVLSVGDAQPNTGDRKVPKRHPLQRLWRLYQFSEEIILLHYYKSPMKASRIDSIRGLVKKWLYMGSRESFLRGTKKCGFYDAELRPHGGPAPIGASVWKTGNVLFGEAERDLENHHFGYWRFIQDYSSSFCVFKSSTDLSSSSDCQEVSQLECFFEKLNVYFGLVGQEQDSLRGVTSFKVFTPWRPGCFM